MILLISFLSCVFYFRDGLSLLGPLSVHLVRQQRESGRMEGENHAINNFLNLFDKVILFDKVLLLDKVILFDIEKVSLLNKSLS